jgi:hypothetical protein
MGFGTVPTALLPGPTGHEAPELFGIETGLLLGGQSGEQVSDIAVATVEECLTVTASIDVGSHSVLVCGSRKTQLAELGKCHESPQGT